MGQQMTQTIKTGMVLIILLGSVLLVPLAGQTPRSVDAGLTGFDTNEAFTSNTIHWPRGIPSMWSRMNSYYGITLGTQLSWTDASNTPHNVKVAQIQPGKFTDIENVVVPVDGAFKRSYRYPYPTKLLDDVDRTDVLGQGDPVDKNQPADVIVYNHANTWTGIDFERWVYGFANDNYSDFIIMEYRFTNTSGAPRNGVYINLTAQLIPDRTQANQPADQWADYYGNTYRQYAAGDMSADSMRMQYNWSGDEKGVPQDNKAKPNSIWGNFQIPQYYGQLVLHADTSPDVETDDPSQPFKAGWSNWSYDLNQNEQSQETLYDILSKPWPQGMPSTYVRTVDETGTEVASGMYRELRPGIDVRNYDTGTELAKSGLLFFGPYDMNAGDDVRIVVAFVGGSISPRMAIDIGRAYDSGYSELRPLEALPYDILNPASGEALAETGDILTKNQKDAVIDSIGRYNLFQTASLARRVWENGNVQNGQGTFNIPLAPPSPSLTGHSENDQIRLEWGDEAAQETNTAVGSITKYKIYRNYWRPPSITRPTDTTFVVIDSVGPNVREYVDTDVIRGEQYYYYVTAVSDKGVESSRFLNRTGTSTPQTLEALVPTRAPSETWQQDVVVVPNPYHVVAAEKYPGRRLNFLNLPAYANIRIYTMAGDLVQVLHHNADTGEEDWQYQDTFSTVEIVSGVYFYVVEELDAQGNPTGKLTRGKFVVIK